jgi:hypothetical protein
MSAFIAAEDIHHISGIFTFVTIVVVFKAWGKSLGHSAYIYARGVAPVDALCISLLQ